LIKLHRVADAKAVLDQAKEKGVKGKSFDTLVQKLAGSGNSPIETDSGTNNADTQAPSNILDTLKLDLVHKLAMKKLKKGASEEAKHIYEDILDRFPKNKKAIDGIKALSVGTIGKVTKLQDPPQDQLKPIINLYTQGQFQQALDKVSQLLQQFPSSVILYNICEAANQGLGHLEAAIDSYKQAINIKPDYANAYYNMGISLKEQ